MRCYITRCRTAVLAVFVENAKAAESAVSSVPVCQLTLEKGFLFLFLFCFLSFWPRAGRQFARHGRLPAPSFVFLRLLFVLSSSALSKHAHTHFDYLEFSFDRSNRSRQRLIDRELDRRASLSWRLRASRGWGAIDPSIAGSIDAHTHMVPAASGAPPQTHGSPARNQLPLGSTHTLPTGRPIGAGGR